MRKTNHYTVYTLIVILILVGSIKMQKLDQYKADHINENSTPLSITNDVWENKLPAVINYAPELSQLNQLLQSDPESACKQFGKKLGISNTWYFITRGQGKVIGNDKNGVQIEFGENQQVTLATSFIFGNAVRDGSGLVDINEFVNMQDFNNISVELNRLVRNKIVPELKETAISGNNVAFAGAFEYNEKKPNASQLRVIPLSIKLIHE